MMDVGHQISLTIHFATMMNINYKIILNLCICFQLILLILAFLKYINPWVSILISIILILIAIYSYKKIKESY